VATTPEARPWLGPTSLTRAALQSEEDTTPRQQQTKEEVQQKPTHSRGAALQQQRTPKVRPEERSLRSDRTGRWFQDTQTGMPLGIPRGARCVQRFDDSLNSAIHITYRISLRSSSMREPRDPLLKVVTKLLQKAKAILRVCVNVELGDPAGTLAHTNRSVSPKTKKSAQGWVCGWGTVPPARGPLRGGARRASPQDPQKHSLMILPQVHLRKPCYDFYFL
jgi:hypothetical protein